MKKKDQPFNNPFQNLKLQQPEAPKAAPQPRPAPAPPPPRRRVAAEDEDAALFLESVGAVAPVRSARTQVDPAAPPPTQSLRSPDEEAESLARLAELVSGEGDFEVGDSVEQLEGSVRGFDPNVMRRLRAGEFPCRERLDLHGLTRDDAKLAVERFIARARIEGHRCVLVVTGRGLHSEAAIPVLREGLQQWLTRGRVSKQVLGFCTARPKDGGAGAVYVLLRR